MVGKAKGKGKGHSGGKGHMPVSRSAKAGITFPVGRVGRLLRTGKYCHRTGAGAAVGLAAVLEYLCAEVLDLAGHVCTDSKRVRILPRHIELAVRNDEDLGKLF